MRRFFANSSRLTGVLFVLASASLATAQVADPVLSVAHGTSSSNVTVTANDTTTGATLYYTVNDGNPTTSSSSLTPGGTISLNVGAVLKIQAYQGNATPSNVVTAQYAANGFLSTGTQHTVVLKNDGTLWGTGANNQGQLGTGGTTTATLPVQVPFTGANPIVGIASKTITVDTNGIPTYWELQNFGQTGLNPSALAPNGSGLTILQCYQQGVNPQQSAPAEPFSVSVSATGPYQAPATVEVVASVSHPATKTIQNVKFYAGGNLLYTDTQAPYQVAITKVSAGSYIVQAIATASDGTTASSSTQFTVTPSNFYQRGLGLDSVYLSSVIAVDQEKGVLLDAAQGSDPNNNFINLFPTSTYSIYPWFLRTLGETNELWQHIASVPILSVNNSTGVLTTTANESLYAGEKITISGATGETAINGTFLVGTVPASNQFTITTLTGGAVSLSGTYTTLSGSITAATFNVLPTANGTAQGGAPPLVAFGSQGGGTPLYTNQSYNFGVAAGGQLVFAPITITSITNANPSVFTVSSTTGLHTGQTIVVSGATGNTAVNGTFLINTVNTGSNQITLLTPPTPTALSGTAVSGITGYTASSASITSADIKVEVYLASSFASGLKVAPLYTQAFTVPRPANATAWAAFVANNYVQDFYIGTGNSNTINFDTQIQVLPGSVATSDWFQQVNYPLLVTHKAANANFYYKVSYLGVTAPDDAIGSNYGTTVTSSSSDSPMAVDSTGLYQAYNLSYTLDFTAASPWQSTYINTPQFQGTPVPTAYAGQSVDQLIHNAPAVSDTLSAPNGSGIVTVTDPSTQQPVSLDLIHIDNSPELRDHTVLDNFVASMNKDPMALANYVQNQINLTDAIGYDANGNVDDTSINPQGVGRDALATFLEGQGSPAEQDALLIYFLRKAGYDCGYVFPQQDQMAMFDEQLSNMLRMQIRGAEGPAGSENVPELIPVNYPWVAAYLPVNGTYKWVHLFPWIKDTVVNEGNDLFSYLPSSSTTSGQTFGYQTGGQWALHYVLNDPNIRQLTTTGGSITDDVNTLFPLYVQSQLQNTGTTLSQLGTNWYNRQNYYTSWTQFPRPWQTPAITNANLAMSLSVSQNPSNFSTALTNIFDTLSLQVFSDRNDTTGSDTFQSGDPVINTGTLRLVDLHDRRFLLYPQVVSTTGTNAPTYNLILSLEAYGDPNETNPSATYTFNTNTVNSNGNATYNGTANPDNASGNPGDLMHQQIASAALQTTSSIATNDDSLIYQINYNRHLQAQYEYTNISTLNQWATFLGTYENPSITDTRYLRKGDMACLCLSYGQVTPAMLEFQAEKYWTYQQTVAANPSTPINPELAEGQILKLMGDSYYNKLSTLEQNVGSWTKTNLVSFVAHGLSKLSPYRNSDGTPNIINGAVNLRYPRVDMSFQAAAYVGNGTTNLNSGDVSTLALDNAGELTIAGVSSYEHLIIDQFFPQAAAVSTVKLLDISQGWTPTTQIASHPGTGPVLLTAANYTTAGTVSYPGNNGPGTTTYNHTLQYWCGWNTATESTPPTGSIWYNIQQALTDTYNGPLASVYVTPGPQYATGQAGQAYTGVGALTLGVGFYGAYITDNLVINDGGYGGDPDIPFSDASSDTGNTTTGDDFTGDLDLTQGADGYTVTYTGNDASTAASYAPITVSSSDDSTVDSEIGTSSLILTPDSVNSLNAYEGQITIGTPTTVASTGTTAAAAEQQVQNAGNTGDTSFYGALQSFFGAVGSAVSDPVNTITGEFYVNALDVKLNGPMPLEIRRIYGSLNQASNNFGYGWRPSYFPYLLLSSDAVYNAANTQLTTPPTLIYAGEMDGSVIAYRRQTSPNTRWIPQASDNPNLANVSGGTIGGAVNPFNNRIDQTTVNGVTVLTLTGADGSVRTFSVQAYPTQGANPVSRVRPYLQQWTDNRGNYYTFTYGTPSTQYPAGNPALTNYGQLSRVQSSNGDYVNFSYDTSGHIIAAYTGDGRSLYYQYDSYGDLTQVTLPDASTIQYAYQHATAPASAGTAVNANAAYTNNSSNYATITSDNGIAITAATNASPTVLTTASAHGLQVGQLVTISGATGNTAINGTYTVGSVPSTTTLTLLSGATSSTTYSTHLIVQETKPNGRILQNTYAPGSNNTYPNRQVVTQLATVGTTQVPVQNACFNYGSPTKNSDGTYTGSTIITDVNSNTTTYKYTESEITEVDYPAQNGSETNQASNGPKVTQTWYATTGSGGYQRSLATVTDRRNLLTNYSYDGNGNLLTLKITGNLTGGSSTSETSTTTMTYNSTTAVNLPGGGSAIPNTLASVSDQLGNGSSYVYADSAHPYEPTTINKITSGGTISTNVLQYENMTGSSASAYGLLQQETIASGSSDQETVQYVYNNNGFPTSETQLSETNDPNIVTTFTYDLRGEMSSQTDAAGQSTQYSYDALGHQTGAQRYDQWGNLVSWNFAYYNQNGDLQWEQGPRYNPNDYTYLQYDGAGRLSQQVKWLSAALVSGAGVGPAGYATTLYQHDTASNLTEIDDPNQNATTMTYDADGEMLGRVVHTGANSGPAISTESMTYEPGGKVATYTSRLGSQEMRAYTYQGQLKSDQVLNEPSPSTVSSESYLYDLTGRVVRQTLSSGSYWVTSYNDLNRIVTRTFYNSGGTQLMQESQTFDRRGNVISKTDVSGNTFTMTYDGLNRIKTMTGPPAGSVSGSTTAQQTTFYVYDAAGQKQSVTNGAGERTDTYFDAEGRPTLVSVFNASGSSASNTGFWYSPDHQSVVKTVGSGAANSTNPAVTTTTWTDTRGNPVLLVHADGSFQATAYDDKGNKTLFQDELGNVTTWSYDALDRVLNQTLPGGAATNFTYTLNSPGETVSRFMPESLTAKTSYDSAGRETGQELDGTSSAVTRKFTNYTYYTSGTGTGLLQSVTDPRGFTTTTTYDAWARPSTVDSSGSGTTAQNTTYAYDNRGMVNSVVQSYASAATGASTLVTRGFDAYGQMNAETTYVNTSGTTSFGSGNIVSQWAQSWDTTGRRTALNFQLAAQGNGAGSQYAYQYNANGLLTQVTNNGLNYQYFYGDNDLLTQRATPYLTQTIGQRDTRGRITAESSTVSGSTALSESMTWRNDERLSSYDLTGGRTGTAEPTRNYSYNARGQLTTEPFELYTTFNATSLPTGAQTATNFFDQSTLDTVGTFGNAGSISGLGVRTAQDVNSFARNQIQAQDNFLRPTMDDYYTPDPTSGNDVTPWTLGYDGVGNVSTRTVISGGTTYNAQTLTWDAYNRLVQVAQRDTGASDYNWTTVYDGFGRRVQTTYQPMNNGVNNGAATVFNYYYDPQVEFLELGINDGGRMWRVYGPDRSGVYGGWQGCGGMESMVLESNGSTYGEINNFFGDALGEAASGVPEWWNTSLGGYGPMPGGVGMNFSYQAQWRGHYEDYTGFVYFGARYYDYNGGHFLAADPAGHDGSMDLYSFAGNDPVNSYDPTGRFISGFGSGENGSIGSNAPNSAAFSIGLYAGSLASGGESGLEDEASGVNNAYWTASANAALGEDAVGADIAHGFGYGPGSGLTFQNYDQAGINGFENGGIFAASVATAGYGAQIYAAGAAAYSSGGLFGLSVYGSGLLTAGANGTTALFSGELTFGAGIGATDYALSNELRVAPPGVAGWTADGSPLVGGVPHSFYANNSENTIIYEHPDATTLSQEEMEYLQLNETEAGVYVNTHEEGTYIGEFGTSQGRAEISAGEKESLYSDPLVTSEIYPTPGKQDAQILESEMIDEADAVNNPNYYNKKGGIKNFGP